MKRYIVRRWPLAAVLACCAFCAVALSAAETRVDGFAELVEATAGGGYFLTPRGRNQQASYVQTRTGRQVVEWKTAPVPPRTGDRVVFAWDAVVSGHYHQSGSFYRRQDEFRVRLAMDGRHLLEFHLGLRGDTRFHDGHPDPEKRVELFFDYLTADWVGNLNGVMYLSVPSGIVEPGRPAVLTLEGLPAERDAFCAVVRVPGTWAFMEGYAAEIPTQVTPSPELLAELEAMLQPDGADDRREAARERLRRNMMPRGPDIPGDPQKTIRPVMIAGLPGNEREGELLRGIIEDFHRLFVERLGYAPPRVTVMADPEIRSPHAAHATTREAMEELFDALALELGPQDVPFIVLAGHANSVGHRAMFNVRGGDPRAADIAAMLDRLPCRSMVVVFLTPVGGMFLEQTVRPGRTVIAANRADQIYRPLFPAFFLRAFLLPEADITGNGRVSLLEAFRTASARVDHAFMSSGYVKDEDALLNDSGDGPGETRPTAYGRDGRTAARMFLLDTPYLP